jgi:hypothetical protein
MATVLKAAALTRVLLGGAGSGSQAAGGRKR